MKLLAASFALLFFQAAPDPDAAQKERVDALSKAARRATVSVKGQPLIQAARTAFRDGFGISSRFFEIDDDLGVQTVELELKDVSFWEAVDRFAAKAGVSHRVDEEADCEPLTFQEFVLHLNWQTFGDLRLFARLSLINPRDYRIDLFVAAPFWAAPGQASIEGVTLDGTPAAQKPSPEAPRPATMEKRLAIAGPWRSEARPISGTVRIEGRLRVTPAGAKEETSIRFSFPKVRIPNPR